MKHSLLIVTFIFASFWSSGCKSQGAAEYEKPVSYSKNKPVKFPDFEIEYTGETSKTSTFPNGNSFTFRYQNFKLTKGTQTKEIQWTSGTGIIEPVDFEFEGSKFTIELSYAEKLKKKLGSDEMVITKLP